MEALLDIANHKLILPQKTISLQVRKMGPSEITLNAQTTQIIKIPVPQEKGNVYLQKDIKIDETIIPAGLYQANNWYINALASNFGNTISFKWIKPAKTVALEDMIEINNTSSDSDEQISFSELENLVRHKH